MATGGGGHWRWRVVLATGGGGHRLIMRTSSDCWSYSVSLAMREQALIAQTFNHWHTRVISRACSFNWQDAAVQYILDTVVSSLAADESRRFTWSEQGFFQVRTDFLNMQHTSCNVWRSLRSTLVVLGKP
jgi:hypothetical protein